MNKQTNIIIRLTKQQKDIISQRAKKVNLSVSKYLRESAVNVTIKQQNKDLIGIIIGMNRIGNNLNQIARKVNANFYIEDSAILLNELKEIDSTLKNILAECKKC